jgi:SAM-dependent methyltransferase
VLEYGTGSGRVGLEIARSGIELVGVDLSRPMLDGFRSKLEQEPKEVSARVRLLRGDMRRLRLRRRFPLVIAPFNVVLHLYERRDFERFLTCVRAHLTPRGRFVFDFSMPEAADLARDPGRHFGAPPVRHPTTGQLVHYDERFEYDAFRQVLLIWMRFSPRGGGPRWLVPLTHRQFFPREMEALLHYNGFTDQIWSKDFGEAPADAATDSIVVSARAGQRKA